MTLMKQARAVGVGVVLSTQNPVDVDYKAMSNAGTWMIGRLQTDRDKARLLEGMTSAAGDVDVSAIDATMRQFPAVGLRPSGEPGSQHAQGPVWRQQQFVGAQPGFQLQPQIAGTGVGRRGQGSHHGGSGQHAAARALAAVDRPGVRQEAEAAARRERTALAFRTSFARSHSHVAPEWCVKSGAAGAAGCLG